MAISSLQTCDELVVIRVRADPEPRYSVLAKFDIPVSKRAPVDADADREDGELPAYAFELQTAMLWIGAPLGVGTNSLALHLLRQRTAMLPKAPCRAGNHLAGRSEGSPDTTSPRATSARADRTNSPN